VLGNFAGGHCVTLDDKPHRFEQRGCQRRVSRAISGRIVRGLANEDCAAQSDVVIVAVPWEGHGALLTSLRPVLAGKLVVDCVNPLGFDKQGPYGLDIDRSAAESAAALVPTARVTGAFHHVSAVTLWGDEEYLSHEDVLVCGDDADAVDVVVELASTVTGRPGVKAGRLRMARQLEPLTAVLISINKAYKTRSGVAISGVHG